jgi:protein involved in polysaccharide export with SLBB domain
MAVAHARSSISGRPTGAQDDLVHFGDVIDVDVLGGFEFDWRGKLNPEGYLDGIDAYGEAIYGLCQSEKQVADAIVKALAKILRTPSVEVRIIDRSNRAALRLDGAVRTPSRFRLRRKAHLSELIVLAGGITDAASGGITILRPAKLACAAAPAPGDEKSVPREDNATQTLNITISDLLNGKTDANPEVFSGDLITVTRSSPIYVIGAVNNPRPLYTPSEITLSRAIAMAGGVTKQADQRNVTIFRRSGGESSVIQADLKIANSKSGDVILKPFDIIDVAGKGGSKRQFPPEPPPNRDNDRSNPELPLRVVD